MHSEIVMALAVHFGLHGIADPAGNLETARHIALPGKQQP
jgi:hypothetical protein